MPIPKIHGQAFQPRRQVDRSDFDRLQASIQRYGLLAPIVVRPRGTGFELISGQRRLLACRKLGWKDIPALVLDLDDESVIDLSLSENLDRLELSPLEKAESLIYISRTFPEISTVDLAERFGVTFDFIETGAKLVALPTLLKEALLLGILTPPQAIEVGRLPDEDTMAHVVARVHRDQLSARETAKLVDEVLAGPGEETEAVEAPGAAEGARAEEDLCVPVARILEDARLGRPPDLNLLRQVVQGLRVALEGEPCEFLSVLYTEGEPQHPRHTVNVARVALYLGRHEGLEETDLFRLGAAAILHDLGMTRIPNVTLGKKGRLSESERVLVHEHPEHALRYLEQEPLLDDGIRRAIGEHHERPDGDGYPGRRKTEAIHPLARLLHVADAYEAMISPRPYKEALSPSLAVQQLQRGASQGAFDPAAVRTFVRAFSHYPIGSSVTLEGGVVGTVIRAHPEHPDRPIVRVHHPRTDPGEATTEIVDLSDKHSPRIVAPVVHRTRT
ncbi:MAG: ParB/RepB/Spo0J family partition protein [Planctomycetes bacterium]|nr:ParB/RepB/Spo0J family partition protein [Planctomycetota bacterium]